MARKPRTHFHGAIYHVICRGNNRESVFNTEIDKRSYLALIKDYKERYPFKLYAWAILSNHAHLLMEVGDVPLSKIMQGIQQSYTGHYNHFNKRTGHVFEQRYKAFLCKHEEHMMALIHYIHQNPARAGLPGGINNPYCSHRDYMWGSTHGLTDLEYPLGLFAEDTHTAKRRYKEFIMQEDPRLVMLPHPTSSAREYRVGIQESQQELVHVPLPELVQICAELLGMNACDLVSSSRRKDVVRARWMFVQFCRRHTLTSQRELAGILGVCDAAISKAARSVSEDVCELVVEMLDKVKSRPDPFSL